MSEPYVLGIGAANIDVHGKSRAPIVMRDSNPGRLRTSAGGVTRNVLENLARLGVRTRLVSAVGADLYGEMVLRQSAAAGIDISEVLTVPGTGFVELVEGDREDTPEAEAAVRAAVEPMLARGADQIVLGCTHYPFLTPVMERIVDGRAAIVDPSPAVARRVGQLLDRYGLRASADNRPALTFRTFADELYRLRLERKVAAYL